MNRRNAPARNINQANGHARAYSVHPIVLCLIGIGGFQPMIVVFAAERCVAPAATRVVSVQGNVTWSIVGSAALEPAKLNDLLCVGDTVRVGAKSRAVLRLPNETTIPLDQNTVFRLKEAISDKDPTLIELIQGAIHVITRTPKPFKVNTPYLNAAVEGTEFYVGVESEESRVAVIEGKVNVSNEQGAVLLVDNEAATARKGQAPQKTLTIKPRDAVQWALYYPPLFDPRSRAGGENLAASHERYSQGDITGAIESLDAIPEAQRNEDYATYRAGLLLLVGRADEAEPEIARALKENGNNTEALSLKAIIAIVKNDKAIALELANQAVNIDDKSASARIALSYALQANFKIEDALKAAREATLRDADNALAWARVAELELSIPNYHKSKEAAEKAVKLNPTLARTQSILGFANLTGIDIKGAKQRFNRAIELDQADPLPRLGLGLATIREGNLEQGREQIEIASSLDPENSLIRSYLGKAYFEEKRDADAGKQYELAKTRDPKDPTPHLYSALLANVTNNLTDGLQDLKSAIERNDGRAVYRSQLLLDQDLGVQGARLAHINAALGFDRLALRDGYESIEIDPRSYAGHRYLAESLFGQPRRESARVSELLQSQVWQSLDLAPLDTQLIDDQSLVLKDSGPTTPGANEYSSAFVRQGLRAKINGVIGGNKTRGDQVMLGGSIGQFSATLGQLHYRTEGFQQGWGIKKNLYDAFLQAQLTPGTSAFAEARKTDQVQGDKNKPFFGNNLDLRLIQKRELYRIGIGSRLGNRFGIAAVATRQTSVEATEFPAGSDPFFIQDQTKISGEIQAGYQSSGIDLVFGGGQYRGKGTESFSGEVSDQLSKSQNFYSYTKFDVVGDTVQLHLGVSSDHLEDPGFSKSFRQVNPKIGFTFRSKFGTTVRSAAFRTLRRSLVAEQTLEPTQFAGFNQFFDESLAGDTRHLGFGVDQQMSNTMFLGYEYSRRRLSLPDPTTNPLEIYDWDIWDQISYFYWVPTRNIAVSVKYHYEKIIEHPLFAESFLNVRTERFPIDLRIALPSPRVSAFFRLTGVRQSGEFRLDPFDSKFSNGKSKFALVDLGVTYRFPKRLGQVSLEACNLFDKNFQFQETDLLTPTLARSRLFFLRSSLAL